MKYPAFPLPAMIDASNPVRCRCHKMLTEMMMVYERIIECLQIEDIKRPVRSRTKEKKSKKTIKVVIKLRNKGGRPSPYKTNPKKP